MRRIYICQTDESDPDNDAMIDQSDLVLLIRQDGRVQVYKSTEPVLIDISVPRRDWSYSLGQFGVKYPDTSEERARRKALQHYQALADQLNPKLDDDPRR